eukprot:CAMPEP_0170435380 /NCGR_PEP_ID=MMETSP0117_2-20130122/43572_1 /TAXON_ID=400756 /ORGANISM="Durinskia baltica, Strain CSIRO CS-38" /LENGTH=55 /DNA_ID=CAMNT_0010695335 /DNA_START=193 /DNA_END=357 /DNA_ORIENTATION=+
MLENETGRANPGDRAPIQKGAPMLGAGRSYTSRATTWKATSDLEWQAAGRFFQAG